MMISFYKGKAVSIPCDTGKHYDTSFGMKKIFKEGTYEFL